MENQHRKIKGYRELSQDEIDLVNEIKEKGNELGCLLDKLGNLPLLDSPDQNVQRFECKINATKDLKQGIMWAVRAVALPESF